MPLVIREVCGIVLIGAGILAIPVPIIPGIPLIVAGSAMLGNNHPLVRAGRMWLRDRVGIALMKEG